MEIGYLTDPVPAYVDGLAAVHSLESLRFHVLAHERIAPDACFIAERMTEADFAEFKAGLPKARRKKPPAGFEAWATRYGAIVLPLVMVQVGLMAAEFKAPWGCCYIRAKEEGLVKEIEGRAYMAFPR